MCPLCSLANQFVEAPLDLSKSCSFRDTLLYVFIEGLARGKEDIGR